MEISPPLASAAVQPVLTTNRRFGFPQTARSRLNKKVKAAIGTAGTEPLDALLKLVTEADLRAFDLNRKSTWWSRAYYMFGLPAAILAAIAGATGLAGTAGRVPAAIIALVAAGLTAAATFLNSEQNSKTDKEISAGWQELADDSRIMLVQCAQKLENDKPEVVMNQQYWDGVLSFQRRKGRLLRGDFIPPEPPNQVVERPGN